MLQGTTTDLKNGVLLLWLKEEERRKLHNSRASC